MLVYKQLFTFLKARCSIKNYRELYIRVSLPVTDLNQKHFKRAVPFRWLLDRDGNRKLANIKMQEKYNFPNLKNLGFMQQILG